MPVSLKYEIKMANIIQTGAHTEHSIAIKIMNPTLSVTYVAYLKIFSALTVLKSLSFDSRPRKESREQLTSFFSWSV